MTVALAEETAVEVPVKLTTQTITNSKTKMNRVEMIRALIDWSRIEDEDYDIKQFFEAQEKRNEQDTTYQKIEL